MGWLQSVLLVLVGLLCCSGQVANPGVKVQFKTLNPNLLEFQDYYLCKRLFTTSGARGKLHRFRQMCTSFQFVGCWLCVFLHCLAGVVCRINS